MRVAKTDESADLKVFAKGCAKVSLVHLKQNYALQIAGAGMGGWGAGWESMGWVEVELLILNCDLSY